MMINIELISKIEMVAPSTLIGRALEDILMAKFGALIVFLGGIQEKENLLLGGFYIGATCHRESINSWLKWRHT